MRPFYKKIIRTLLLLLVFAAVVPFVYPMKNGKPLLSLDRLELPSLPELSLPDIPLLSQEKTAETGTLTTAYKWRDPRGNWQFGSEPPRDGPYETLQLDPNVNLIQGEKAAPEPAPEGAGAAQKAPSQADDGEVVFGYTPAKIEAMMEKTHQVKEAMEAHHQALEGLDR